MTAGDVWRAVTLLSGPRATRRATWAVAADGRPAVADQVARSIPPVVPSVAAPAPLPVPVPPASSVISRVPSIVVRVGAPRIAPLLAVLPDRSRHRRSMPRPIRGSGPAAVVGTAEPGGQRP